MVNIMYILRYYGYQPNNPRNRIDEVFFTCPECEKMVYDEAVPYQEFLHYCQIASNTLTCDECEAKGHFIPVSRTFRLVLLVGYANEAKRLSYAKSTLLQLVSGVKGADTDAALNCPIIKEC